MAALWMKADGQDGLLAAFDNMASRATLGDAGWQRYEIVVHVPEDARTLAFGVKLGAKSQAWPDTPSPPTLSPRHPNEVTMG